MKIQHTATRVLERTSHYLQKGVILERPAWYDPVAVHPTGYDLTKRPKRLEGGKQKLDPTKTLGNKNRMEFTRRTKMSKDARKNRNNEIHAVPKIRLLEDQIRDLFYHQHPWEFARPKNMVETHGNENTKCDWSHMRQLYKPLDGESVVQRTLHLLKEFKGTEKKKSLLEAYDQARYEFYQLRMTDEMSATVSREESAMCGAIYASTNIDFGLKKEQEAIDAWTHEAAEMTKAMDARRGSSNAVALGDTPSEQASVWEATFEADVVEEEK